MKISTQYHSGFSLLELLLAIGIMSILTMGAARIFDDWAKSSVDRKVASEMVKFQDAAEAYVEFNFNDILINDIPNVGDIVEIGLDDIEDGGFLPENFRPYNSYQQQLKVVVRHVSDNGINGSVFEILTLGENKLGSNSQMADKRLFNAASIGGPRLGVVSDLDLGSECCRNNIQSVYGEWSVSLSDFMSVYNVSPNDNGGYMAGYGRISVVAEKDSPYLYRVEISDQPHLNKMNTNLDMNGHDIINGGVVVSDNANANTAEFQGQETNSAQSAYVLSVVNDMDINGDMEVLAGDTNKGDLYIRGDDTVDNDFIVNGELKTYIDGGDINFSDIADPSGNVSAANIFASNVTEMGNGVFDTMEISAGGLQAGNIYTLNTISQNNISANTLQTSSAQNIDTITAGGVAAGSTNFNPGTIDLSADIVAAGSVSTESSLNVGGSLIGTQDVRIRDLTCVTASDCP